MKEIGLSDDGTSGLEDQDVETVIFREGAE
jgi:hypothetical protein